MWILSLPLRVPRGRPRPAEMLRLPPMATSFPPVNSSNTSDSNNNNNNNNNNNKNKNNGLLSQLCEGILWDLNVEAKRGVQNSSFPFAPSAHYLSKLVWVNMERLSQATNDDSIPSLSLHHHFSTATKVVTNTPGPTWSWRTTRSSTPVTLAARAAATTALRTSRTTRLSSASCALAEIIFPTSRARPPAQIVHW